MRGCLPRHDLDPASRDTPACQMTTQVRLARPDDREPMLELWERAVRATHYFLEAKDIAALRPLVAEELASDTLEWWVLATSEDDTPVGFLGFANDAIEALFIDPAWHGRGEGRRLVAHAYEKRGGKQHARHRGRL